MGLLYNKKNFEAQLYKSPKGIYVVDFISIGPLIDAVIDCFV